MEIPSIELEGKKHPLCEVVRIQRKDGKVISDCQTYIGRACFRGGWELSQSKWHNPFTLNSEKKNGLNDEQALLSVCAKYYQHVKSSTLKDQLEELRGQVLGCWCDLDYKRPLLDRVNNPRCHGEVLLRLLVEKSTGSL